VPVVVLLLLLVSASVAAVELTLDRQAVDQALAIGRSRVERDLVRFHLPYRLPVNTPPVDYIDVVTPFRRIVLEAEQRTRAGDRSFGQRQAQAVAAIAPGRIDVLIELTFHPMNAYVGVPGYEVELRPESGSPVRPRTHDRVPRFGPRVDGTPLPAPGGIIARGSEPMLGGTVVASFDGQQLSPAADYDVVILESGKVIAKARVALGAMR
jgi:hypothetical protein